MKPMKLKTFTICGSTLYKKRFLNLKEAIEEKYPLSIVHIPDKFEHADGITLTEEEELQCVWKYEGYIAESDHIIALAGEDQLIGQCKMTGAAYELVGPSAPWIDYGNSRIIIGGNRSVNVKFGYHTLQDLEFARIRGKFVYCDVFTHSEDPIIVPDPGYSRFDNILETLSYLNVQGHQCGIYDRHNEKIYCQPFTNPDGTISGRTVCIDTSTYRTNRAVQIVDENVSFLKLLDWDAFVNGGPFYMIALDDILKEMINRQHLLFD